jgi:peptidoglycan L-alanyl-D-glutamate endopeptidase CwlK
VPYKLGIRSRRNLLGVHHDLAAIAEGAIGRSTVDFAITEGLRTPARQAVLYAAGASKTMNSRHLTGHAIDVVAFVGSEVRWEFDLYRRIAEAFRDAADALKLRVEWGACWMCICGAPDLSACVRDYVNRCDAQDRRPLIDGPHFQLSREDYP